MSTTTLLLFAATFATVLALGAQSLNVNGGHRLLAACTSVLISSTQLVLLKTLPGPTTAWDIAAYMAGGVCGILAAMAWHPPLARWMRARRSAREPMQSPLLRDSLAYWRRAGAGPGPALPPDAVDTEPASYAAAAPRAPINTTRH